MASDTAQVVYPPADPVAEAAAVFKTLREPEAPQPLRDDTGRFARAELEPVQEIEAEADAAEVEVESEQEVEAEAAEEAQPERADMPSSWSKEDADLWDALPAETQAKLAEREAQQHRGLNQKFQTIANERKALEASLAEANSNRNSYREAIDMVLSLVNPVQPDPRAYGLGTQNYNRDAYDLAMLEYQQTAQAVQSLQQQQQEITAQQAKEAESARNAEIQAIEEVARPRFMADVPDLAQPDKAGPILHEIVRYAVEAGIPEYVFQGENASAVTSAELHLAWKAMQYDKQQEAKTRVAPKARPAAPPVRPGAATPRATQQSIALQKDLKNLAATGTIEAGAAVFKHFR